MLNKISSATVLYRVLVWTAVTAGSLAAGAQMARADEYRAFWVDGWGAGFLNQSQVDDLLGVVGDPDSKGTIRDANCNMVIVQVRRRFDVCYPSGVGEPYMSGLSPSNFNALQAMINAAHDTTGGKKRIEVHCWSVAFKTGNGQVYLQHDDPADPENYWPTRVGSTSGVENGDGAFDPGHPNCLEYLVNAHMDLVSNFDIDGIHYDYIRFEGNTEGYNPTSVARYNQRYGLSGDPASSSAQFKQWRRDQVTAFVRQMYARVQTAKPWVKQSGSFVTWNPSPASSTRSAFMGTRPYYDVYSDWDSWMEEGIVDMAVPMTYYNWASLPSDYTRWINFEKDRKFNRHMIIGPGTYLNSLSNAILELQMTRDPSPAGNYANGFSGYSYRVPYSGGTWAGFSPSLVAQVTPTWADIPTMPWKTNPTTGHIMGTVTQVPDGAWADHATVSITGPVSRSMYVDGTGFYAFIDLPPGSYSITASKAGYADAISSADVAVGQVTGNMYIRNLLLGGNPVPVIFNVQASNVTNNAATITWTTDLTSSSQVEYGLTPSYGSLTPLNSTPVTSHSVQLSGLAATTLYHYRVISANANGSTTSSDYTFTTSGPPQISDVQAINVGSNSATITWTTNAPADSQVRYGLTSSYGQQTTVDPALVTSHSVNLTGLAASTLYHYQVVSTNAYGTAQSTDFTFTTGVPVTEIVIDNTDPGWTNTSPDGASWIAGTVAPMKIGTNYLYTSGSGSTSSITRSCRWTPTIQTAGLYDVYVYYQIGANRNEAAPYTVVYDGGQVVSIQNQYSETPNLGGWFLVGENLPFAAGTAGYVQVANNSLDTKYVSADAAKFVLKSGDTQAPSVPTNLTATAASTTSIQLSWTASTDNVGVTGYNIYRNGDLVGSSPTAGYLDATGLAANTGYDYEVSAVDAVPNESGRSAPVGRATLSLPPSTSTVTCNRSTGTPYPTGEFQFTAVGGFGSGTVTRYRFAWDQSAGHTWGTGVETDWTSGVLSVTATQVGNWYLYVKGYNSDGIENGTADLGPYNYLQLPAKATAPTPAHQATGIWTHTALSWTAGAGTTSHKVYFGTVSPGSFRMETTGTAFDPGVLLAGTTYFWRIDGVNASGTTTGDVWEFMTRDTVPADLDRDGDVDAADGDLLEACVSGPGVSPNGGCGNRDLDGDGDADQTDFGIFQRCLSGADVPAELDCGS
ncbi:MAG: family 10 glycosylhydrolase [Phycisphaerae bacterium]|nr:family 10 glycosylhydrolase [Phycisphaerae bacterium]